MKLGFRRPVWIIQAVLVGGEFSQIHTIYPKLFTYRKQKFPPQYMYENAANIGAKTFSKSDKKKNAVSVLTVKYFSISLSN